MFCLSGWLNPVLQQGCHSYLSQKTARTYIHTQCNKVKFKITLSDRLDPDRRDEVWPLTTKAESILLCRIYVVVHWRFCDSAYLKENPRPYPDQHLKNVNCTSRSIWSIWSFWSVYNSFYTFLFPFLLLWDNCWQNQWKANWRNP